MRRGVGRTAVVVRARHDNGDRYDRNGLPTAQSSENRALVARFFVDLRLVLRLTLPQTAYFLQAPMDDVEALELGQVERLPSWAETSRIVLAYASMANVDGRPVLNAIGALLAETARPLRPALAASRQAPSANNHLRRAGSAIANGAKRLPSDAIAQIRRRPQRTLYALSVPLGALLLTMHTSVVDTIAKPFGSTVRWVSGYVQEHFAPVRDGLRYIEVDDPRSRRTDKLRIGGGSY